MRTNGVEIALPEDVYAALNRASKQTNLKRDKIVEKALIFYLSLVIEELREEFKAWELASDEALMNFETTLRD